MIPWGVLDSKTIARPDRVKIGRHCLQNFRDFCRLCEPPKYSWDEPTPERSGHRAIADAICYNERGIDGRVRVLTLAPRGGGKSSLLAQRYTLWRIVRSAFNAPGEPYRNGSLRVLYITETADKAAERGRWLLDMLENSRVTKIYGHFEERRLWGATKFTIRQRKRPTTDPTFTAVSPQKSSQGGHFDLIIPDDVVTLENTGTIDRIEKLCRWFLEALAQVDPDGEIRACGTPHHEYDLYARLQTNEMWKVFIFTIESHDFANLPPEVIIAKRRDYADRPEIFSAYFMCEPFPSEMRSFKQETFKWITADELPAINVYLLADVASMDSKHSCQSAYVVVGIDAARNIYLLDISRGKWDPDKSLNELHRLWTKWNPLWGGMEERTLTPWVTSLIDAKVRETGTRMHFETANRSGYHGKLDHIKAMQRWFAAGEVYFVDTLPEQEVRRQRCDKALLWRGDTVHDLERFPKCTYFDVLDAMAYVTAERKSGGLLCPPPPKRRKGTGWQAGRTRSPWQMPRFRRGVGGGNWQAPMLERMARWANGAR